MAKAEPTTVMGRRVKRGQSPSQVRREAGEARQRRFWLAQQAQIEAATGKDVAGMIIDFIAANAKVGKTKTKGAG